MKRYHIAMLLILTACSGNQITITQEPVPDSQGSASGDIEGDSGITAVDGTVEITFSENGAKISGWSSEYGTSEIEGNDVTLTNTSEQCLTYRLSGTASDGFFKLYSSVKQTISLDGVNLTNPGGAAINNQSHKYTAVTVNGANFLADGAVNSSGDYPDETDEEDMKAAFFSEGQLIFSGDGSLTVTASGKSGITTDDYIRITGNPVITVSSTGKHGIRGKDEVLIEGGTIDITVSGTGAKGINCDGNGSFTGGKVTVTATGANSGSSGGWGSGWGGSSSSSDTKAAKGIKFDGNIVFSGADVTAKASSHEAIEAKGTIVISGGNVSATSSDDAINSGSDMTITGGNVYAYSSGNDGLDANGNMYVKGGYVYAVGSGSPEVALDANTEQNYKLYISGGSLAAFGGIESGASITQPVITVSSWTANAEYSLYSGDTLLLKFTSPSNSRVGSMVLSHPSLVSGSSYTLKCGSSSTSVTASLNSSSQGGGNQGGNPGGGHGGGPGGRW